MNTIVYDRNNSGDILPIEFAVIESESEQRIKVYHCQHCGLYYDEDEEEIGFDPIKHYAEKSICKSCKLTQKQDMAYSFVKNISGVCKVEGVDISESHRVLVDENDLILDITFTKTIFLGLIYCSIDSIKRQEKYVIIRITIKANDLDNFIEFN